jgi:hypothetical protein
MKGRQERPHGSQAPEYHWIPSAMDPARAAACRTPVMSRDRPVILNYRLVLHRRELAPADIARLQAEYPAVRIAQ